MRGRWGLETHDWGRAAWRSHGCGVGPHGSALICLLSCSSPQPATATHQHRTPPAVASRIRIQLVASHTVCDGFKHATRSQGAAARDARARAAAAGLLGLGALVRGGALDLLRRGRPVTRAFRFYMPLRRGVWWGGSHQRLSRLPVVFTPWAAGEKSRCVVSLPPEKMCHLPRRPLRARAQAVQAQERRGALPLPILQEAARRRARVPRRGARTNAPCVCAKKTGFFFFATIGNPSSHLGLLPRRRARIASRRAVCLDTSRGRISR